MASSGGRGSHPGEDARGRGEDEREGTEDADEVELNAGLAGEEYQADEARAKEEESISEEKKCGPEEDQAEGGESEEDGEDDVVLRDYWERRGHLLIRHHVSQRTHLFDPQDVVYGFPEGGLELGPCQEVGDHDPWRICGCD